MKAGSEVALRRLFRVVNGGTPTSDDNNWGGGIHWATPVDLGRVHGRRLDGTDRTLSAAGLRSGSAAVPAGSLIVSTRAPIGYVAETTTLTAFNQGCKGLIPIESLDTRFYRYVVVSMSSRLQAAGQGSTFVELSADALVEQRVPTPLPAAQRAIADFLDTETARIDALITKKRRMIDLLNERLRGEIEILTAEGAPTRVRFATALITSGPRGWSEFVAEAGRPFVRSANLRRSSIGLRLDDLVSVEPPPASEVEAKRSRLAEGDVLVGITGANTGWVGVAGPEVAGGYVSQHVALLRPSGVVPEWLGYSVFAHRSQGLLLGSHYGGTKQQLGLADLAELPIHLPTRETQLAHLRSLGALRERTETSVALLASQISLLQEHRQALITAAVTGELEVPGVAA